MDVYHSRPKSLASFIASICIHLSLLVVLFTYKEIVQQLQQTQLQQPEHKEQHALPQNIPLLSQGAKRNAVRFQNPAPAAPSPPGAATSKSIAPPEKILHHGESKERVKPLTTNPLSEQQSDLVETQTAPPSLIIPAANETDQKIALKIPSSIDKTKPSITPAQKLIPQPKPQQTSATDRPLTLKDITKGFFKNMRNGQQGGPATIESNEAHRGEMIKDLQDADVLAAGAYKTKVFMHLDNSVKTMSTPNLYLADNTATHAELCITLNKNGKPESVILNHPAKTETLMRIEQYLQQAVLEGGLYPPIPKRFSQERTTIRFPLRIYAQAGVHTYQLSY